jgi:hypothetical protein
LNTFRHFTVALACAASLLPVAAVAQQAPPTPDIVVDGATDGLSPWRRAESAHVIVTSTASEAELKRITNNLERLHALMSRLYREKDAPDETVKLQITLVDKPDFFRTMRLRDLRAQEGPYPAAFATEHYYDPREDGAVLVVARADQMIDLATKTSEDQDYEDAANAGDTSANINVDANHPPIGRSWEAVLYSAFAEHFMLTYQPAAYPRWYIDGVGALFSTIRIRGDGSVEYARPPLDYYKVFRAYGDPNVAAILTGAYLDAPAKAHWTPYHAWLIAHYFLFSQLSPERSAQFRAYMVAARQGKPLAEAAKAFGDLRKIQYAVMGYAGNTKNFAKTAPVATPGGDPLVTTLSRSSAALIEARIEMGSRLAATDAAGAAARADWLAGLHRTVEHLPYNSDAILTEAEAQCRGGAYAECGAAVDRVLAKTPDDGRALAWKGIAQTHLALAGPATDRAAGLAAARKTISAAIHQDRDAPLALIAAFQSYTEAGERVPDAGMLALAKVIREVPDAPAPRLYLAHELIRQGKTDLARGVAHTVLYGTYDSPEKAAAAALFASGTQAAGR